MLDALDNRFNAKLEFDHNLIDARKDIYASTLFRYQPFENLIGFIDGKFLHTARPTYFQQWQLCFKVINEFME